MLRASLRGIWDHKVRTLLLAVAVVAGVSFVTASFVFTDTIGDAFTGAFAEFAESLDATVSIDPDTIEDDFSFGQQRLDAGIADNIAALDSVDAAYVNIATFVQIVEEDSDAPAGFGGPPNFLFGWTGAPGAFQLSEGRAPESAGEIVADADTAADKGWVIGDTIEFSASGPNESATLVGLVDIEGGNPFGGAVFIFAPLDEVQRLADAVGEADTIDVVFAAGADQEGTLDEIQALLPDGVRALDAQTASAEQAADLQEGLGFITIFLLIFAAVAVSVGTFVVYNAFRTVIGQRTRELALFRLLGATRGQVLTSVLVEAAVIGVIATLFGIPGGVLLALVLRLALSTFGGELPAGDITLAPRTVLIAAAVGVITTVLSALIPAIRASRVLPMAALSDVHAKRIPSARRWTIAIVLLAGGIGASYWALATDQALWIVGVGALLIMAGTYALGAAVSAIAMRAAGRLLDVVGKPMRRSKPTITRQMAIENARRAPRRTGATAGALMIGVSLVTAVAIIVFSIQTTTQKALEQAFPADAIVFPGFGPVQALPDGVGDAVLELPEVARAALLKSAPARINGQTDFLVGVQPEDLDVVTLLDAVEGSFDDLEGATVAVQQSEADRVGLDLGDDVEIFITGEPVDHEIVVIFDLGSDVADAQSFYIDYDQYAALDPTLPDIQMSVLFADGVAIDDGKAAIETALEEFGGAQVFTQEDLLGQIEAALLGVLVLIFGLLAMSIVIALIGVVLILSLSVFERTREIGLVRAIGMVRTQVRSMVRWEAFLVAVLGALLGMLAGLALGWFGSWAVFGEGFSYEVPWIPVIGGIFGAGIAGLVAAWWPAYRAANLNILEAIAYE